MSNMNDIISYLNSTPPPEMAVFNAKGWSLITEFAHVTTGETIRYFHMTDSPVIAVSIGDDISFRFPMPAESVWLSDISDVPTPDDFVNSHGDQAIDDGFEYSAKLIDPRLFAVCLTPDALFGVFCTLHAVNSLHNQMELTDAHSPEFPASFWPAGIVGFEEMEGTFSLLEADSTGKPIEYANGFNFIENASDATKRFTDHGFTVVTEDDFGA